MGSWAEWTAKTALLAAGFAAAVGGPSGVALAAGGSAGSEAGPGLGLGRLVAPAGPSYSPAGGSRARAGYERGVWASGIHVLFSWLLLWRLRMCGLGV
jgi:hypothetical protein